MPNNNNRINFQVGYNVDQASVNAVKKSLQDLQNIKFKDFKGPRQDLEQIKRVAGQVQSALTKAFNVNLNSLNTQQFNASLKESKLSIDGIYNSFSKAGAQGQVAFSRMASEVLTTNMQLKQTNSLVSQMGETMANTVKWGIASSVMNNFTNSVRQAFDYVKALDSSLNDIRIVTKQSSDEMANFAVQANNSAQALGRSTMDYTKAALTFYQQGLDEASVQARTQSVLKAQNITGAGQEMADYLTAVWNGYKVANEEAELYVDKLAAVADSSASNMSQLAIAMSKVASSANLLGVPVDSLNAQIATIVATTRQAPESVGNALKTIYSRINDIATGADDAQISLGNYSKQMAQVGVNVLDANGRLRDTGDVIDEIGGKWETLSHEQQIYLARTMAGQRQYNNLLALFENWGKYSDLVNISMEAQGATAQKNAIYLESLSAKMQQLGAAGEKVKAAFIDEEDLKGLVDFGTGAVNLFGNLIQSIGGGKNAILALGSIFTQVFSGTIAKELNNVITNFQNVKSNAEQLLQLEKSISLFGTSKGYQDNSPAIRTMVDLQKDMLKYSSVLTIQQRNQYNELVKEIGQEENKKFLLQQQNKKAKEFAQIIASVNNIKLGKNFKQYTSELSDGMIRAATAAEKVQKLMQQTNAGIMASATKKQQSGFTIFKEFTNQVDELNRATNNSLPSFDRYTEAILAIRNPLHPTKDEITEVRIAAKALAEQFNKKYDNYEQSLDNVDSQLAQILSKLGLLKKSAKDIKDSTAQLFNVTTLVKTVSSIGQFASALSSLSNLKNIWTNQNLSSSQKILQTVTNLGMAIPMLITSYKSLNSTLGITNTLKTLFGGITKSNTVALGEETVAQYGLNAAMEANPIGVIILGITAAIAAVTALVKIYDHFTMSVKEADQAIDAFNEKQKQMANNNATFYEQTANLESMKDQYEQLAEKAGAINFDATIDNLTETERQRYNQIKNAIAEYNEKAMAGYNAQGQVILKNNTKIEDQIELLKQRNKQDLKGFVESKQFKDKEQAIRTKAGRIQQEIQTTLPNEQAAQSDWFSQVFSADGGLSNELNRALQFDSISSGTASKIRAISFIMQSEGLIETLNDSTALEDLKNALEDIGEEGEGLKNYIQQIIDHIETLPNFKLKEEELNNEYKEAIKIPADMILAQIQAYNYDQYDKLVNQYGQALTNSLIQSYIEGAYGGEGFTIQNTPGLTAQAAEKVKKEVLETLSKIQISDSDIEQIQQQRNQFLQSLSPNQTSIEDYKKGLNNFIQKITYENDDLLELAKTDLSLYEELIKTIFGFDDFSAGMNQYGAIFVQDFSNATTKSYDAAKQKVQKYFKQNPIDYSSIKLQDKNTILENPSTLTLASQDLGSIAKTADDAIIEGFLNQSFNVDLLDNVDLFIQYLGKIEVEGGNVKQALDQAAEATRNYVSTMDSISTFDLLQQASTGELDDQQFGQLSTELDALVEKEIIVKDTANILKTEWMQGTDVYKNAIQQATNALLDYYQAAKNSDPSGFKELSTELAGYITNTQTLDEAYSRELITQKDAYDVLGRLGRQYQSCQDELNAFSAAVASGDEQAIKYTGALLQMAIAAEQAGQALDQISIDPDINEDEWKDLTQYLSQYGEQLEGVSEHVEEHKEAAEQLAEAMLRYDHALEQVADHYDDWQAALTSGSIQDAAQAANELQNVYSDLLDLPYQSLSPDFTQSVDNLHLLQQAANGSEQAYAELQERAGQDILAQVGLDTSQFYTDRQSIYNSLNELTGQQWDDIQIGASLDDADFLASLTEMVNAAGMTAQQATDYLASMGVDAQVIENNEPTEETKETSGWTTTLQPIEATGTIPTAAFLGIPIQVPIHYRTYQAVYTPDTERTTAVSDNKAVSLKVTSAHKSSGGGFKHRQASHGGGSKAPRSSGRGGGGGGKGSAPKAASQAKISTTKINTNIKTPDHNPYQQEQKSFQRQSKILDELQNKQKKLVNKDRLKNLEQQNKVLEKQKDILKKELDISGNEAAENSTANYANRLKKAFKDISFDQDGQIADINKIQAENADIYNQAAEAAADAFEKEKAEYNNYIQNVWNKYTNKDQQDAHKGEKEIWDERIKNAEKTANDSIKKAEQVYKEREDLIKSYNKAWEEDQNRLKEYNELTQQIYDNLIDISKIRVDLSIDIGEFERDWLDFRNKFIKKLDKEDFLGNAEANVKQLMSYFDSQQIQQTKNQIADIYKQIDKMRQGALSQVYGTNIEQAEEDLKNYMQQQMKDLQDIQDLSEKIMENYLDALDDAKDKMDDQIDQYERVNDLVEHNMKLTQMLYGDKAYDTMEKYYDYQKDNNQNILNNLRAEQLYWQTLLNQQTRGSDAWKQIKENLDDVTDNLNSKLQDMIDNLANQFENRVNGIIDRLNNALTAGRGLDFLDEQWDYISNYDDNFLDTFETKTGIDEVERLYQSQIDNLAGSPKSQQALNKLMNDQLKLLREKDHLTEYDLERAKASLEVEKARLALEEARDNKTKMRLRRDSQGNYTYQYVADEQKLGDLQAALADAQANLYNTDKQHYKQNLNTLYDTYKDYIEKMRDLTAEYNATQDEEERKRIQGRIDLLKESTAKIMDGLTEDNSYLLNYLNGSFFDGMGVDTSALTMEEQMEIMKENIPYIQSNIQDLADTIVGEGGILPATADMVKQLNNATTQYDKNVEQILASAGTNLQTISNVTDAFGNSLDKNILQVQSLTGYYTDLIDKSVEAINEIQKVLSTTQEKLNELIPQQTIDNLAKAYNLAQLLNGVGTQINGQYLDKDKNTLLTQNKDGVFIDDQLVGWNLNTNMTNQQYQDYLKKMSNTDSLSVSSKVLDTISNLDIGKLQQQDLKTVVSTIQAITSNINSIAGQGIDSIMSNASGYIGNINNVEQLDQNVHIEANFPNVTQHTQIEQALQNLVNMASMRASKYRD